LDTSPILNFEWHIPNLLATGGKPDTMPKLNWLINNGIENIVSLDPIPDLIHKAIFGQCGWMRVNREDAETNEDTRKDIARFIGGCLAFESPVFVHCSAGIKLSSGIVREFLLRKDQHIARYLALRANDLNHGDDFDWFRGHSAFCGDRLNKAISSLERMMSSDNPDISGSSADTLIELMEHAGGDNCFNQEGIKALKRLLPKASKIVFAQSPKFKKQVREIIAQFKAVTK